MVCNQSCKPSPGLASLQTSPFSASILFHCDDFHSRSRTSACLAADANRTLESEQQLALLFGQRLSASVVTSQLQSRMSTALASPWLRCFLAMSHIPTLRPSPLPLPHDKAAVVVAAARALTEPEPLLVMARLQAARGRLEPAEAMTTTRFNPS